MMKGKSTRNNEALKRLAHSPSASQSISMNSLFQRVESDRKKSSDKLFNGGSAYDCMLAKPKIRERLIENSCWSYVDVHPVAAGVVAAAVGIAGGAPAPIVAAVGALVEDMFIIPKPVADNDAATAIIDAQRLEIIATYDDNDAAIAALPGAVMNANARALALHTSLCERRKEVMRNDNTREVVLARLVNSVVQWEKDKLIHENKVSACLKVFNTSLGPSPLAVIRNELTTLSFRNAWAALNAHYATSVGGQQNVSDVLQLLNTAVFIPQQKTVHEHIEDMLTIANEVTVFGAVPLQDEVVLDYILNSLEKSACKDFEDDLKDIRRRELPLVDARRLFQKTESRLLVRKSVEKQASKRQRHEGVFTSQAAALTDAINAATGLLANASPNKKQNGGSPNKRINPFADHTCSVCGNKGHQEERCWSTVVCHKCKKTGHLAKFCPSDGDNTNGNKTSKKVSIGDLFAEKK